MLTFVINNQIKIKKIFLVLLSFLFFAAILFGDNPLKINTALADGAWFNDGSGTTWSNRFMITPSAVNSDLDYDLSLAPAEFWDHVRSDGGDIRITAEDGTTQLPREVSGFGITKGADFAPHDLTSNTSHSPFVTSSSHHWLSWDAWRAFDGNLGGGDYFIDDGGMPVWVSIDIGGGDEKRLYSYAVSSNTIPEPNRAPKNWTFLGSNDETNWDVLDTQTNQTSWGSGEIREFTIPAPFNRTKYRYFRINVTTNNGDGNNLQIRELYLYETTVVGSLFIGGLTGHTACYIYYGNPSATEPAADSTYGKYAVWESAYSSVLHSEDYNDSTVNQLTGTNNGTSIVDGKIRKAWDFGTGGPNINLGNDFLYYPANAITVILWIKTDNVNEQYLCTPLGDLSFYFAMFSGKLSLYINTIGGWWSGTTVISDDAWHQVAFTYDKDAGANNIGLYVDGNREFTGTSTTAIPTGSNNMALGTRNGSFNFTGLMDDFRFLSRALSPTEIATLYANQSDPASFWTTGGEEVPLTSIGATTGTHTVGSVLTAGALTPSGATADYQWYDCTTSESASCTSSISGATSSAYTLQTGDLGDYVAVTATGTGSYIGSVTSTPVGIVTVPLTSIGATTGTPTVGSVLTAGALTPSGADGNVTYQWQVSSTSDGVYSNISLATSSTYTVSSSDVGYYIKVQVTGTGNYSGTVTSSYVGPVTIPVTGITVTGADSATSVLNGGTLQMSAAVLPFNATNQTVTWSVTNGTGSATINSTSGLLTAAGAGTVTVTASATDGSGITGTEVITVAVAPSAPSLVLPASGSYTANTTPTLSASYYNSTTGDTGKTNYRIDSSSLSDCIASSPSSVVASGASATTSSNSQNTTWTSSTLTNGTYYWCAQNEELSGGFTSSWTSMGTFMVDTDTPSGGSISYTNGYAGAASVLIAYATGSDSGSGLNDSSGEIQRASAALSNGSCGMFSSFANLHQGYNDSPYSDTSVSSGNCYEYRYVISDNAGNQVTYSPSSASVVKVDLTAPVTTALMTTSSGSYSSGTWINQNVTVDLSNCADSQSGCLATYYCDDSATCTDWSVYLAPQTISTNGTTTFRYYSTNNAGNSEPVKSQTIKVDATTPTTSDNFTGNGVWIDADPTITLYPAINDISGLAWTRYCEDTTLTCDPSQGTDYNNTPVLIAPVSTPSTSYFRYASADNAGNIQTTVSLTVMIDTSPQVTQVLINTVNVSSPPTASSSVTITNEGRFNYEYQYAWCVVESSSIPCNLGGVYINGADSRAIFYGSNAKNINAGDDFITTLSATVPMAGTYYFEVVTYYDTNLSSSAFQQFTIGSSASDPAPSGGGGWGGGMPIVTGTYDAATVKANSPDINTDKGLSAAPPFTAWCVSGLLIKGSLPDVYYCGADGKRYVFANDKAYFSWYADFSTVKTIADETLALIPLGGNVTYRPGVRLVKIQADPKVYAIARGGVLRWIMTEAIAARLYGANWNTMIDDVPDSFFVNYTVGEPIIS